MTGLLHRRDLVALGARRRHGKTNLALNLAVSLAEPASEFLGYPIPQARRTLLVLVEDDPGELQDRLRRLVANEFAANKITLVTREDFYKNGVRIDVTDPEFQFVVQHWAKVQFPDVIVLDNLAHLINVSALT